MERCDAFCISHNFKKIAHVTYFEYTNDLIKPQLLLQKWSLSLEKHAG